jgi:hypothetical protein
MMQQELDSDFVNIRTHPPGGYARSKEPLEIQALSFFTWLFALS